MKEVVKKEIIKLLDAGIIYAIEDSPWVSPVHYVPKKGGMTIVTNEDNELVPTRTVTGWRVCIDYRKLNEATRKDHFPLPFMDQMLERLSRNKFFCFLDGFSGYFQIPIELADQEKTTFTCPYKTYAYKHMPFGHKVSSKGLEVDKAKVDVIAKLPPPTNVKAVRSFLGHAGFYRRFIKYFSKIYRPMTKLLEKDSVFNFDEECNKAFETLKEKLNNTPIMVSPNWSLPFELMCDASDYALNEEEINDEFPDEFLMSISTDEKESPWFTDFANYLVRGILRKGLTYAQRYVFMVQKLEKSSMNVIMDPLGDIMDLRLPQRKFLMLDFIGQPYLKKHRLSYKTVKPANVLLHELDELRLQAYENSKLYKAQTKAYHDKKIRVRKEFKAEDKVLLYNSKYKFKAPKLRSKWYGPFIVKHGYPSEYVELYDKHEGSFIVNGHHVKLYHDEEQLNELTTEEIHLMCEEGRMKAIPFREPFPANYRETMPWASEKPYIYSVVENTCNEAKLYDLDETGKGIMIENILYVPSKRISLGKK
ncbi:DNA-directed DNA polymerase [Tanacetum coccineum]